MNSKIVHRWAVGPLLRDRGTIVATCGCFDVLHIGHKRLLESARKLGDVLIVGINDDESVRKLKGTGRPLVPVAERAEMLTAFSFVDYVVIYREETANSILTYIRPDIFVKGGDNKIEDVPEKQTVENYGGHVELIPITLDQHSSQLVEAIGPSDEVTHAGFTLRDMIEKESHTSKAVAKMGVVLTADGLLEYHSAGLNYGLNGKPEAILLKRNVTKRYALMMKVATG